MSSNAAKLRSHTKEDSDEAQRLRSKLDEVNSKNASTSESGVDSKRASEAFKQQHENERLKGEETFQSKNDAEKNINNVQNQLQQEIGDLKFSLDTKDTQKNLG